MCGLAGFLTFHGMNEADLEARCLKMTDTLSHRGPDDGGVWVDQAAGVALGHRRLSILDLSPLGRQPMVSKNRRYVIVYNGEVYNHAELRRELEPVGHTFSGGSDTEVVLAAVCEWGVEAAIGRFVGMFAIALWDREERVLYLVRDRLGIKPLYYGWGRDGTLLFASELKGLRAWPAFDPAMNMEAVALFLRHNYIPTPHTIYQGAFKLSPGHFVTISPKAAQDRSAIPVAYWDIRKIWERRRRTPASFTDTEAVEALEQILRDAVRMRMIADVPLGALLSGGIDSSAVVALMQSVSSRPVRTFSIGFREDAYNEAHHAKRVAEHLGTDHTELFVTPQEALAVIEGLPRIWDEPFADSSQIPTYLVSRLTREHVTVALSGDGGDELFYGYRRYPATLKWWAVFAKIPNLLGTPTHVFFRTLSTAGAGNLLGLLEPLTRTLGLRQPTVATAAKVADLLKSRDFRQFYGWTNSHGVPQGLLARNRDGICPAFSEAPAAEPPLEDVMSYLDLVTYLPDDILVKVDRASMAVALEARVPLLDHRVVEFAMGLPLCLKVREGGGKWLLRQVLYRHVPRELVERPKMGFGVPIDGWLRGPLRGWAEDLLSEQNLKHGECLNPRLVRMLWEGHMSGRANHQYLLWNILMFQAWRGAWA